MTSSTTYYLNCIYDEHARELRHKTQSEHRKTDSKRATDLLPPTTTSRVLKPQKGSDRHGSTNPESVKVKGEKEKRKDWGPKKRCGLLRDCYLGGTWESFGDTPPRPVQGPSRPVPSRRPLPSRSLLWYQIREEIVLSTSPTLVQTRPVPSPGDCHSRIKTLLR